MVVCPSCGQENPDGARFCNAAYTRFRAGGDERTKAAPFMERAGILSFPGPGRPVGAGTAA